MPWKEVTGVMNRECLTNMCGNEVVKAVLASRANRFGKLGWKLCYALDGLNVVLLFSCRKCRPEVVSVKFVFSLVVLTIRA